MLLSRRFSAAAMLCLAALALCATSTNSLPSPGRGRKEGRTRGRRLDPDSSDSKDDSTIGSSFTAGRDGDAFSTTENNIIAVVENTDLINAPEPTATPADMRVVASGSVAVNFSPTKAPKSTKAPKPVPAPRPVAAPPAADQGRDGPSGGTTSSTYDVSSNNDGNLVVNGNVIPGLSENTNSNGADSGNSAFNSNNNNNGWVVVENTQSSGAQVSTETSNLATTYEDKCAAAEAGKEYRTRSTVPVYYEYELVTSSTRNVLQVADIVDGAIQHFLAVWLVDW